MALRGPLDRTGCGALSTVTKGGGGFFRYRLDILDFDKMPALCPFISNPSVSMMDKGRELTIRCTAVLALAISFFIRPLLVMSVSVPVYSGKT